VVSRVYDFPSPVSEMAEEFVVALSAEAALPDCEWDQAHCCFSKT